MKKTGKKEKTSLAPAPAEKPAQADSGVTPDRAWAGLAVLGLTGNASLVAQFSGPAFGKVSLSGCQDEIIDSVNAVEGGKTRRLDMMLMSQAVALNAVYVELMRRAGANINAHPHAAETLMRLALKAQNQSRMTLQTLAEIRNPRTLFVTAQQANIAQQQQVNNGAAAPASVREIEIEQTQLSESCHELLPDARASGIASGINPALETVGKIDWPENARRKKAGGDARLQRRPAAASRRGPRGSA
jgi:hypothetical protein